jgi:hypothetical protein
VLRQVAAYRGVCEQVRKKATGSLVFGCMMLAFWWFVYTQIVPKEQSSVLSIISLSLAVLEIGVGLLNRFFPTAEGVLLDALVVLGFAASNAVRGYLMYKAKGKVDESFVIFGVLMLFQGLMMLRAYFAIVRGMRQRPTRAQLRWFADLLTDLRTADPKEDRRAVAFPSRPAVSGLLLADSAFFLTEGEEMIIVGRDEVELEAENHPDPTKNPRGYLTLAGNPLPPFALSRANWDNYAAWKREGGVEV